MNSKIFNFLQEKTQEYFSLPKYHGVRETITADTKILDLPWTPARLQKFKDQISETFDLEISFKGTVSEITGEIDKKYLARFFGNIWKPRTDEFQFSGWGLVDELKKHNFNRILDIGCGYNQFKQHLPNIIGIDPYNIQADYMVDILDFEDDLLFDAALILGSINFNQYEDVLLRMEKAVSFVKPQGFIFQRVNPGIQHTDGPWVEVFPWSFKYVKDFAKRLNLNITTFKQDTDRLFVVYQKNL
jgi:hypothetical protein